jgi:hypothetical protein
MKKNLCIAVLAFVTTTINAQSIGNERLVQSVQAHLNWTAQPIPHTVDRSQKKFIILKARCIKTRNRLCRNIILVSPSLSQDITVG